MGVQVKVYNGPDCNKKQVVRSLFLQLTPGTWTIVRGAARHKMRPSTLRQMSRVDFETVTQNHQPFMQNGSYWEQNVSCKGDSTYGETPFCRARRYALGHVRVRCVVILANFGTVQTGRHDNELK